MSDFKYILEKWATYSKYDPEQTKFNLLNNTYELHKFNEVLEKVISEYDNSGALAVILAKQKFIELLKEGTVSAWEVLNNKDCLIEEKEMLYVFSASGVTESENTFTTYMNKLIEKTANKKMLGDINQEEIITKAMDSIFMVIKSLNECSEDLYTKGGEMLPISNFNTNLHIFPSLASCLTTLERVNDGMYLCYINNLGSADGYFGFYIKNNGNLLSVNERIDEAYKGSHKRSRNGRWAEAKKDKLFPYGHIFKYSEHDYKGWATKYSIDNDFVVEGENYVDKQIPFFEMEQDAYIPLLLAMVLLNNKFSGKVIGTKLKYVDTLLNMNIKKVTEQKENTLVIIDNSQLVASHSNIDIDFDRDKVMSGEYAKDFNWEINRDKNYREIGTFKNENQLFVDLWGEGFEFDINKVYETNSQLLLTDESYNGEYTVEFVGTQDRMRLQGYVEIRNQLAAYIREKIYAEFVKFGMISGMKEWFKGKLKDNIWHIEELAIEHYKGLQNNTKENVKGDWRSRDTAILYDIDMQEDTKYVRNYSRIEYTNELVDRYTGKAKDIRNGTECSIWFVFKPKNYRAFEEIFGCDVPKILKGWESDGHFGVGNDLISATDAVSRVGTPFERWESNRNNEYEELTFRFVIGFSKRGFKQAIKEHEEKLS